MPQKKKKVVSNLVGRTTYESLLDAFREIPGNVSAAARSAGVGRETARRAWLRGWTDRHLPAIKDVLREEQVLARSRRQAAVLMAAESADAGEGRPAGEAGPPATGDAAARMLAKDDAVATREQEGQMVKLTRANTIALMSAASRLISAGIDKARELETKLKTGAAVLTPSETMRFMASLSSVTRNAAECAKMALEMERLLMGEPTAVIGIDASNMSLEDAARTIEIANRALERARSRGLVPTETPDLTVDDVPPADPSSLH